jgi:predicted nucleotidyltransferase
LGLPPTNRTGELPPGVHKASWEEVTRVFGQGGQARRHALIKLRFLHDLARTTSCLARFLVFGSFVSGKPAPRDVDVVLVMIEAFRVEDTPREARTLFSHADAEARYGASIFWVRDGSLRPDEMAEFLETWQTGRDGRRRGLLEIVDDRR